MWTVIVCKWYLCSKLEAKVVCGCVCVYICECVFNKLHKVFENDNILTGSTLHFHIPCMLIFDNSTVTYYAFSFLLKVMPKHVLVAAFAEIIYQSEIHSQNCIIW